VLPGIATSFYVLTVRCGKFPRGSLFLLPVPDGVQLRVFFSGRGLARLLLPYIRDRKESYGQDLSQGLRDPNSSAQGRRKIVIEFSSPNIVPEFTQSNLRSTLIGGFLSNLYESMGWEVVKLNYLGDWGRNIGLLAVGWAHFGSEEALEQRGVAHLLDVYRQIDAAFRPESDEIKRLRDAGESTADAESRGLFAEHAAAVQKMEEGDAEALALSKRFRDIMIKDLTRAYARLGIRFDEYSGESLVRPETVAEVDAALRDKNLIEETADGSWVIDFERHTGRRNVPSVAIRGRGGSSTYLLRDVAAAIDRERAHGFDRMAYVVSSHQDNHIAQLFATLELLGRAELRGKLVHERFGDIQGMERHLPGAGSLGAVLDASARLMQRAKAAATGDEDGEGEDHKHDDGTAAAAADSEPEGPPPDDETTRLGDLTAVSALLAQDMNNARKAHNYAFDGRRLTSFEAETGLRLQMTQASLNATIASLRGELGGAEAAAEVEADFSALEEDEEATDLLRRMAQYPEATAAALRSLEPQAVMGYLFRFVDSLNAALAMDDEEDGDDEDGDDGKPVAGPSTLHEGPSPGENKVRLLLYEGARQVMENGMKLLGFPTLPH